LGQFELGCSWCQTKLEAGGSAVADSGQLP
jgi:hypothetical protein